MAALTEDCRKEIEAPLGKGGPLVGQMTWLFDLLHAKGLLWESILPCNQIGVHPMNRNGAGTSASHVEELLTTFVELGFCMSQTKCVCIEVPTGDAMNPWQGNPKDGWRKLFRAASGMPV